MNITNDLTNEIEIVIYLELIKKLIHSQSYERSKELMRHSYNIFLKELISPEHYDTLLRVFESQQMTYQLKYT